MGAEGRAPVRDPPLPRRGPCPLSRAGTLGRTKGKGGGSGGGLQGVPLPVVTTTSNPAHAAEALAVTGPQFELSPEQMRTLEDAA